MAYVLSLRPHSPLKRSFSDNPYLQSCSPLKEPFLGPLGDVTARNTSACSLYTLSSNRSNIWNIGNENTPPLASQSLLNLVPESHIYDFGSQHGGHVPRKRNCGGNRIAPSIPRTTAPSKPFSRKAPDLQHKIESSSSSESSSESMGVDDSNIEESELFNLYEAIHVPLPEGRFSDNSGVEQRDVPAAAPETLQSETQPFRRWMSTLRRRHLHRRKKQELSFDAGEELLAVRSPRLTDATSARRTSESITSSMGFVTNVKTTSVTVASTSIAPMSERAAHKTTRFGNRSSNTDARRSFDSNRGGLGPVLDESAWLRSLQRRKVVEELMASEESYIADLKVLINDYFMILTALPALPGQTKSSIQQNIAQILQLHEDLLAELQQAVPQADFTKSAQQEAYPVTKAKHIRFHSADIIPGRLGEHRATRRLRHSLEIGRSPDRRPRGLVTDTTTVGNIAKIFNRHMKRFFTYEEYGAHWTTMSSDLTLMCKGLHGWQEYERGVEALQKIVASENNRESGSKKALSFPDLLIKPIQRVCKYPLLFDDLCRQTPVCDDPEAHAELEKALFRLQETIREVNKAKDDPKTRRLIEITWQLQDRLVFQEQSISRALVFRLLGHVLLCGVLHVAYQTPERVKGQYMICVLYKSCLVLATTSRFFTPYNVVACISLANGSIEEPDNGRGVQCHTASHTWKFVFEHNNRLHEIILSACSSQEEETWKTQLRERAICETHDFVEGQSTVHEMFSFLGLDLKSLGPVFGHADSLVRRMSVHRAATLGAKTNLTQVIIKNTQAQKPLDTTPTFSPGQMARSHSMLSANHIPTLAPRRAERMRLETALEEVWTKDVLPFPGMSTRSVENQIRASANSVMRKLSMASIASNFSRRSPSFSSMSNTRSEDSYGSRAHRVPHANLRAAPGLDRRPAPAVVDFHNAPAAFLPTDFELQDTRPSSRRRRLANRAGGAERSTEKPTPVRPKRTRRLSSHIISLPRSESSARVTARSTSDGSNATVLRGPEPTVDTEQNRENAKPKRKNDREGSSSGRALGTAPSKKFLKSKSRIFKFWV
ncbi:Rho guanyl nucleotide exchange factor [Didymella exigua CBS 183.55]|uniref:Rho guanyl nucleotide exchange factor n=1 Tax=Didymella exigua CBS 183.55 TaxID=1150837 RepID=A0A6A5RDE1_9PLEO|nr:Rho guanyl nucleotide exchange factor [Didymella exigua CBS 183.55]KAF1926281.1 Rho guanyl nucleotide exchange factor [Didymella exigua CBS 183.55]